MKKIRIKDIEGYYYVDNNCLIYNYETISVKDILENKKNRSIKDIELLYNECDVSDLTELKVYQYNELVKKLWVYYPNYNINKLEGKFI